MYMNRAGESGLVPDRSQRFYQDQSAWFFNTREGASIGPFDSKCSAEKGLADFLDFIALADPHTLSSFYAALTSNESLKVAHN